MKPLCVTNITLALLLLLISGLGCKEDIPPPSALPADQFAATFNKALAGAKAEAKDLAAQVVSAVQGKDYSMAFTQLQTLTAVPGLTKEQQSVLARALLTVNERLAAAQSQGDQKAAQTIQDYQRNR